MMYGIIVKKVIFYLACDYAAKKTAEGIKYLGKEYKEYKQYKKENEGKEDEVQALDAWTLCRF